MHQTRVMWIMHMKCRQMKEGTISTFQKLLPKIARKFISFVCVFFFILMKNEMQESNETKRNETKME